MNYHQYASPKYCYTLAGRALPWLATATVVLLALGLYWGLALAPPDYQQGESYRIMFVHVPSAWMSLFVYVVMAGAAAAGLIWNLKLGEMLVAACAPLGAAFTLLALVTGSLWGKPMWGAWWAWDARLTAELILLFLYLGIIALQASIDDPRRAGRAAAVLALVGIINIPIIHFSVEWWNTLHQPASITRLGAPAIHPSMLTPLLLMVAGFQCYFFTALLLRLRNTIVEREWHTAWVRSLLRS